MQSYRIPGFDSLRFYMVLAVVCLHAAMSYMLYAPSYWYVMNPQQSGIFTMLVILLDAFPMSILFFLSGYFAVPSFQKKGFGGFLKSKCKRIGLPWILGVLFVAPFFAYASMSALGYPRLPASDFYFSVFLGYGYQQSVYWFLAVLFFFFFIFAMSEKYKKTFAKPITPILELVIFFIASSLFYALSVRFLMPASSWINAGFVLYFQPARFAGYGGIFLLGVHAFRNRWFLQTSHTLGLNSKGTNRPSLTKGKAEPACGGLKIILVLTAALSALVIISRLMVWSSLLSPSAHIIIDALSYNMFSLSMTMLLTICFSKKKSENSFVSKLSKHSFSIYWLHLIVLMPCVYLLIPLNVPIFLKWAFAVCVTVLLSAFISRYILKNFLKRH
jgi:peptidoglycan/LPS O-acetylase OafA/YrhL